MKLFPTLIFILLSGVLNAQNTSTWEIIDRTNYVKEEVTRNKEGNIISKGETYYRHSKFGLWTYWYDNGNLWKKVFYKVNPVSWKLKGADNAINYDSIFKTDSINPHAFIYDEYFDTVKDESGKKATVACSSIICLVEYYSNGNLKSKSYWKNLTDSNIIYTEFDSIGHLQSEQPYSNGTNNGISKYYYADTNLVEYEIDFVNDRIEEMKVFSRKGTPCEIKYFNKDGNLIKVERLGKDCDEYRH